MGGKQDSVKTVWLDDILAAVLAETTEPVSWLTRHDYVLMSDVKFEPNLTKVAVRHLPSGHTSLAKIVSMPVER
jgi:hypothetical protein